MHSASKGASAALGVVHSIASSVEALGACIKSPSGRRLHSLFKQALENLKVAKRRAALATEALMSSRPVLRCSSQNVKELPPPPPEPVSHRAFLSPICVDLVGCDELSRNEWCYILDILRLLDNVRSVDVSLTVVLESDLPLRRAFITMIHDSHSIEEVTSTDPSLAAACRPHLSRNAARNYRRDKHEQMQKQAKVSEAQENAYLLAAASFLEAELANRQLLKENENKGFEALRTDFKAVALPCIRHDNLLSHQNALLENLSAVVFDSCVLAPNRLYASYVGTLLETCQHLESTVRSDLFSLENQRRVQLRRRYYKSHENASWAVTSRLQNERKARDDVLKEYVQVFRRFISSSERSQREKLEEFHAASKARNESAAEVWKQRKIEISHRVSLRKDELQDRQKLRAERALKDKTKYQGIFNAEEEKISRMEANNRTKIYQEEISVLDSLFVILNSLSTINTAHMVVYNSEISIEAFLDDVIHVVPDKDATPVAVDVGTNESSLMLDSQTTPEMSRSKSMVWGGSPLHCGRPEDQSESELAIIICEERGKQCPLFPYQDAFKSWPTQRLNFISESIRSQLPVMLGTHKTAISRYNSTLRKNVQVIRDQCAFIEKSLERVRIGQFETVKWLLDDVLRSPAFEEEPTPTHLSTGVSEEDRPQPPKMVDQAVELRQWVYGAALYVASTNPSVNLEWTVPKEVGVVVATSEKNEAVLSVQLLPCDSGSGKPSMHLQEVTKFISTCPPSVCCSDSDESEGTAIEFLFAASFPVIRFKGGTFFLESRGINEIGDANTTSFESAWLASFRPEWRWQRRAAISKRRPSSTKDPIVPPNHNPLLETVSGHAVGLDTSMCAVSKVLLKCAFLDSPFQSAALERILPSCLSPVASPLPQNLIKTKFFASFINLQAKLGKVSGTSATHFTLFLSAGISQESAPVVPSSTSRRHPSTNLSFDSMQTDNLVNRFKGIQQLQELNDGCTAGFACSPSSPFQMVGGSLVRTLSSERLKFAPPAISGISVFPQLTQSAVGRKLPSSPKGKIAPPVGPLGGLGTFGDILVGNASVNSCTAISLTFTLDQVEDVEAFLENLEVVSLQRNNLWPVETTVRLELVCDTPVVQELPMTGPLPFGAVDNVKEYLRHKGWLSASNPMGGAMRCSIVYKETVQTEKSGSGNCDLSVEGDVQGPLRITCQIHNLDYRREVDGVPIIICRDHTGVLSTGPIFSTGNSVRLTNPFELVVIGGSAHTLQFELQDVTELSTVTLGSAYIPVREVISGLGCGPRSYFITHSDAFSDAELSDSSVATVSIQFDAVPWKSTVTWSPVYQRPAVPSPQAQEQYRLDLTGVAQKQPPRPVPFPLFREVQITPGALQNILSIPQNTIGLRSATNFLQGGPLRAAFTVALSPTANEGRNLLDVANATLLTTSYMGLNSSSAVPSTTALLEAAQTAGDAPRSTSDFLVVDGISEWSEVPPPQNYSLYRRGNKVSLFIPPWAAGYSEHCTDVILVVCSSVLPSPQDAPSKGFSKSASPSNKYASASPSRKSGGKDCAPKSRIVGLELHATLVRDRDDAPDSFNERILDKLLSRFSSLATELLACLRIDEQANEKEMHIPRNYSIDLCVSITNHQEPTPCKEHGKSPIWSVGSILRHHQSHALEDQDTPPITFLEAGSEMPPGEPLDATVSMAAQPGDASFVPQPNSSIADLLAQFRKHREQATSFLDITALTSALALTTATPATATLEPVESSFRHGPRWEAQLPVTLRPPVIRWAGQNTLEATIKLKGDGTSARLPSLQVNFFPQTDTPRLRIDISECPPACTLQILKPQDAPQTKKKSAGFFHADPFEAVSYVLSPDGRQLTLLPAPTQPPEDVILPEGVATTPTSSAEDTATSPLAFTQSRPPQPNSRKPRRSSLFSYVLPDSTQPPYAEFLKQYVTISCTVPPQESLLAQSVSLMSSSPLGEEPFPTPPTTVVAYGLLSAAKQFPDGSFKPTSDVLSFRLVVDVPPPPVTPAQ